MSKAIWQVRGKLYYRSTGELVRSKRDAAEFWELVKSHKQDADRRVAKAEAMKKVQDEERQRKGTRYRKRWLPALIEYFGDADFAREIHCKKDLLYTLATSIFDNDGHVPGDMKRLFPTVWKQALVEYSEGDHDT